MYAYFLVDCRFYRFPGVATETNIELLEELYLHLKEI